MEQVKKQARECLDGCSEIIFAYLHGSVLESEHYNDIDIAAYIDKEKINEKDIIDYEMTMSIQLEQSIHYTVDFKVLNDTAAAFAYHATAGVLLISNDDSIRYDFIERIWQEYFDLKPFIKEFLDDLIRDHK
ncbi:MAG: nucleotidyltransferase domain-containing protein [Clostridiales bacterium]|nr:nucleotidyltransferase domain-containing protein [Clostridiales bacterium]